MEYFIYAVLTLTWLAVFVVTGVTALMKESIIWTIAFAAVFLVGLTLMFWSLSREENTGPCFVWENSVRFDPATKTMRKYKRCVDRGEWIDE